MYQSEAHLKKQSEICLPGATARVRPTSARTVLHQANFPPVDVSTIQLVQSPLHVGIRPELNHSLIGAFLVGICIGHLSCLTHEVLVDGKRMRCRLLISFQALLQYIFPLSDSPLLFSNIYLEVLPTTAAG